MPEPAFKTAIAQAAKGRGGAPRRQTGKNGANGNGANGHRPNGADATGLRCARRLARAGLAAAAAGSSRSRRQQPQGYWYPPPPKGGNRSPTRRISPTRSPGHTPRRAATPNPNDESGQENGRHESARLTG